MNLLFKLLILPFKIIGKIIHFRPYSQWTEEEKIAFEQQNNQFYSSNNYETTINPATGLPMIGCLDVNGNSIGSSSSYDSHRRTDDHYDYNRTHATTDYNTSYNPFTNRY